MTVPLHSRWQSFKEKVRAYRPGRKLSTALHGAVGGAVAGTAVTLVVMDILRGGGFELPEWVRELELINPAARDEIREYVQFTKVPYSIFQEVTTGIQYDTSNNRAIEKQWCYLTDIYVVGGRHAILELAGAEGNAAPEPRTFSESALEDFELTEAQALGLIQTHCRFQ